MSFVPLTWAFEAVFDKPLCDLPEAMRQRIEREFFPMPWDSLSADQRRTVALQLDYQHDPATEQDRQFWWDFYNRKRAVKQQIEEWERVATPTAGELAIKESRLQELRQELARMGQQERQNRGDYYPKRPQADNDGAKLPARYIPYPKAMRSLATRLDATPEELAAWVWLGQRDGGLAAYLNANELDPPRRFYYDALGNADDFDYLSPLMACWFNEDDVASFEPTDRFINGKTLIERWSKYPEIQPEAFIRAKIAESRLLDAHPIYGSTQGTTPDGNFPPLESGLFALAHVEAVEAEEFDIGKSSITEQSGPCQPVEAWQIRHHFRVVHDEDENDRWWKERMANARRYGLLDCRAGEGKKGRGSGSLWKPAMIAGWVVDRHTNGKDGMTEAAAHNALKQFPGCEDTADQMFAPNPRTRELP